MVHYRDDEYLTEKRNPIEISFGNGDGVKIQHESNSENLQSHKFRI